MFGSLKQKMASMLGLGVVTVTIATQSNQANAMLIQSGSVKLEDADITAIQANAAAGLTTYFEGLKLLGVVVLVSGGVWIVNKAFNSVAGMFGTRA